MTCLFGVWPGNSTASFVDHAVEYADSGHVAIVYCV